MDFRCWKTSSRRYVVVASISVMACLSLAPSGLAALPGSVATPIQRAKAALAKTEDQLAHHRYRRALDSLLVVRRNVTRANKAATAQIGLPPTDPESDDLPGPPSVFAALKLDHRVTARLVPMYDALGRLDVVSSLSATLQRAHGRRDAMLDAVIALPAEGDRADYDDGMADMLGMYPAEEGAIAGALATAELTDPARSGLTDALARVRATEAKVDAVWGGGE
jgi:PAS domain-containing protein